jgi:XTP/dITP diphosphohydrolase
VLVRHADDPQPVIADGSWHGEIRDEPLGSAGFGYDPHFWLPQLGLTAAQLEPAHKNSVSHRGIAMGKLLQQLTAMQ